MCKYVRLCDASTHNFNDTISDNVCNNGIYWWSFMGEHWM